MPRMNTPTHFHSSLAVCAIHLWDADTGKLIRSLTGHTGRVESLAFSPDGKIWATGGGGGDCFAQINGLGASSPLPRAGEVTNIVYIRLFVQSRWRLVRASWEDHFRVEAVADRVSAIQIHL